jgi:hypothetical protein
MGSKIFDQLFSYTFVNNIEIPTLLRKLNKISISVFFLILFLLPTIVKGLHTHCNIVETHYYTSGQHFQTQDHHCFICDFTSIDSKSPILTIYSNLAPDSYFLLYPLVENISFQEAFLRLSSRAPPIA